MVFWSSLHQTTIERNYVANIAKPRINDEDRVDKKRVMLTVDDFKSILKEVDKNQDAVAGKRDKAMLMILANLGQRSYNFRTTFPKYTDSVPELSGQEHCPRGTSWHLCQRVYHFSALPSSAAG